MIRPFLLSLTLLIPSALPAQLAAGMAWWFKRYASDQPLQERHSYEFEEAEARARRVGLWADPQQTPPWDWRANKR